MAHIRTFDHVGITVADLDTVVDFFRALGLQLEGRTELAGDFVDTVVGLASTRTEIAVLRPPGGGTGVELSTFLHPGHAPGNAEAMPNELGLRNICFEVDDLPSLVETLAADGYPLVGGVGQYEDVWRMAYVRGPEGIIVSLAERLR